MITLKEAHADLRDTQRDVECLKNIIDNLRCFIEQPGALKPENRSHWRMTLMKTELCLAEGQLLITYIKSAILKLNTLPAEKKEKVDS